MINNARIVPVTQTDLLSLYGLMLAVAAAAASGTAPEALAAADDTGDFTVATNSKTYIASEPVKSLNFGSGVTAGTVYFVAAYDYSGFSINGTATTTAGAEVQPDGRTLYTATLSSGTVTIAKVGF